MTPAQEVLLERLKYSGQSAVSTLEPRDCKALHEYVVELQQERDELAAKVRGLEMQAAARAREDAVDVVVASVEVVPVAEDRTKPPPGYEPFWGCRCGSSRYDSPDYDARYCVWFEGEVVAHGNTLSDAIAAAWARRDARAKR